MQKLSIPSQDPKPTMPHEVIIQGPDLSADIPTVPAATAWPPIPALLGEPGRGYLTLLCHSSLTHFKSLWVNE